MEIKREADRISFTYENGSGVICAMRMEKAFDDETVQSWIKHCAKLVQPYSHSFAEMEEYLLAHYDARPLAPEDLQMQNFKSNVLIAYFDDRLEHKPPEFSFDMTDEEIEHWHRESMARQKEASAAAPEQFGLKLHGYKILLTGRSEALIEADLRKWEKATGKECPGAEKPECFVFWEESSHAVTGNGLGCSALMHDLNNFLGITREDIDGLTPRFLVFIHGLAERGGLPSLKDFAEAERIK